MLFMDFCAGIGGGRLGLMANGLSCVAHSEIDDIPNRTYRLFFGTEERNFGDLMIINPKELPNFDVLICGFPCQTFSVMGKRKGFGDKRGQIIYGLLEIIKEKDIPYFILENVKGLLNHDNGQTIQTILKAFDDIGYNINYNSLNSLDYGVPQMRERVYIVGIKKGLQSKEFRWPKKLPTPSINNYLIDTDNDILKLDNVIFQKYLNNKYNKGRINISNILQKDYLIIDWRQSDLRVYENRCPTLRNGRHGILYVKGGNMHKLSGFEALLLQGFPLEFAMKAKTSGIDNTKLLAQAGNAMTVNVIKQISNELLNCI